MLRTWPGGLHKLGKSFTGYGGHISSPRVSVDTLESDAALRLSKGVPSLSVGARQPLRLRGHRVCALTFKRREV